MNENKHKILVTYASKYGSTGEIARRIAEILAIDRLAVDLFEIEDIADISSYSALIIGSSIYVGKWRPEAVEFLKTHAAQLAEKDVWIFSSGPTGEGDPADLLNGWIIPPTRDFLIERIEPHDAGLFNGVININKLNVIEKMQVEAKHLETGDFRDWDAIERWAKTISTNLMQPV